MQCYIRICKLKDNVIKTLTKDKDKGEKVITISSPQVIINTISDGIVSSIRKEGNARYIQITAPVSEGSSGGALLNMKGELIGIITFKAPDGENLNFALSSNDIREFLDSSMRNNKNDSGYVLPHSDKVELTSEDLKKLNLWHLSLARNEIYARHEYVFRDPGIRKYFEEKKWYNPNKHFSEEDLNEVEKSNIGFILVLEEMRQ